MQLLIEIERLRLHESCESQDSPPQKSEATTKRAREERTAAALGDMT